MGVESRQEDWRKRRGHTTTQKQQGTNNKQYIIYVQGGGRGRATKSRHFHIQRQRVTHLYRQQKQTRQPSHL